MAIAGVTAIEGLVVEDSLESVAHAPTHPNGALGIDHVVAITPDFDRTSAALADAGLPLPVAVPLLAALLSLPAPAAYPPLTLSPERQKQQTLAVGLPGCCSFGGSGTPARD